MACGFMCFMSLNVISPLLFTGVKHCLLRGCDSRAYKAGHLDLTMHCLENQGVRNGKNDFEVRENNYLIHGINIKSSFKSSSEFTTYVCNTLNGTYYVVTSKSHSAGIPLY